MEKTIKLEMCKDKTVKIYVNNEAKYEIQKDNRTISAGNIYEIIGFSIGDQFTVIIENEFALDNQVLEFFGELFTDIVDKVNAIDADAQEES